MEVMITGTLQYPNLVEPRAPNPQWGANAKAKYSVMLLIEPTEPSLGEAYTVSQKVIQETYGNVTVPMTLRSGQEKADRPEAGFRPDNWFISATCSERPYIAYAGVEVTDMSSPQMRDFYPGCQVRALIDIWPEKRPTFAKRLNSELRGIEWLGHGTAIQGGAPPKESGRNFGIAPVMPGTDPAAPAAAFSTPPQMPAQAPPMPMPTQVPPMPMPAQAPPMPAQAPPMPAQAPPMPAQAPPMPAQAPPMPAQAVPQQAAPPGVPPTFPATPPGFPPTQT